MTIKEPLLGQLNQGTIFTCARAERYPTVAVHGVVLTARCDLQQDKYNVLNYVPAVSFADWLTIDGYDILLARASADVNSRIESALKSVDLPKSIMNSQTPSTILDQYIRVENADRKLKQAESKFIDLDRRITMLERWTRGYCADNDDVYSEYDGLKRGLIKDLIHQRLSGYYFLPRLQLGTEPHGFVIMLREVAHLPHHLAVEIGRGLDAADPLLLENPQWKNYVDFSAEDFAMPVGEIGSPEVEHLLQIFSQLFGRIGLPDPDQVLVDSLCDIRPLARVEP